MNRKTALFCCVLLLPGLAISQFSHAQPVIAEPEWTLIRTIDFTNPMGAHYNAVDGLIYVGRRATGSDGLYRIDRLGFATKVAGGSDPAAVVVQPDSGHVFFSEDYGGGIFRTTLGGSGRLTWVSGFHSGDDDPLGMAFAPTDYTGGVLLPGDALVVDRGNSGLDEIWAWSPFVAQGETQLHADNGTLVDAVDIAIDQTSVLLVDTGGSGTGIIYEVNVDGSLTPFATSDPIGYPVGITFDPLNGDLLILDRTLSRVVRVNRASGLVSDIVTGFSSTLLWAGVDISPEGRLLVVTDYGADQIYLFGRCDATGHPELDCNGNEIYDLCEIIQGAVDDCNFNDVPDDCDLSSGASDDCNLDGLPDECPICPPVEVVFIMDTSSSMDDEASALCGNMGMIIAHLEAAGLDVQPRLLGICNLPGGAYSCLEDHVINLLGSAVPGSPPPGLETLGACPGGYEVCQEDWGLATAVVAGLYPWLPDSLSIRMIIPLTDEGAWCGDPVTANDHNAVDHAITIALENNVIVSPVTGSGSSSSVIALAQAIADTTGGTQFNSSTATMDIAEAIVDLVLDACAAYTDCNDNGVLDECDIAAGTSLDTNGNGIPDECEVVSAVHLPGRQPGLPHLAQNYPNPFNPLTRICFDLSKPQMVDLAVFTMNGRRVATLVSGMIPAGSHEAVWYGRNDKGRRVGSGTYFYRLKVESFMATKRMTLLK